MKNFKYILSIAVLALLAACNSTSDLDRSQIPAAGPAPIIQLGDYEMFTMDNGLKVIVVKNNKLPRVSYSISVNRDPLFEGDIAGYSSFSGELMRAGTTSRTKEEIDEAVDFMGASLGTSSTGVYGSSLTKHSDTLLTLMSDVLLNPVFPVDELEKVKTQAITSLASAKTNADGISGNLSRAMNYGLDHPYGEKQTEENIENIQRQDLIDYYTTYFRPNISYLVVIGDITLEQAQANANKYFGAWERADVPSHEYAVPTAPEGNHVAFVDVPGSVQSVIKITYPVDMKPGSDDAIAARVMNAVLGGGVFSGRLMQNLREDKAYTYGARSSLSSGELVGNFSASASVRNEVTDSAIVQFMVELERMTTELVPDSTVQFVKNSMAGSFARSLESPSTIASFALSIEKYGLPKDYYQNYLTRLAAVTPQDVMDAAKKYIKPNNANITVVGSKAEVADKLAVFDAEQTVHFYNMYGEEDSGLEAMPEGVTATTVVNAYVEAIGGMDKVKAIKSVDITGNMDAGMPLEVSIKMKNNEKYLMSLAMGGNPMMTTKYDGTKAMVSQMGQEQVMEGEEAATFKSEAYFCKEAFYTELGTEVEALGVGDLNGEACYVISVAAADGSTQTDYYAVSTGLKLQSLQSQETPQGMMTATSTYSKYQEFDGIMVATSIDQSFGPQVMNITYTSVVFNGKVSDSEFAID